MQNKSQKKLWIALASLAVVLIVGLSVTVGVLAATNATVTSSINVTYTSREVAVWVDAGVRHGETGDFTAFTGGENGVVKFSGSETTASGTLTCPENESILTNVDGNRSATFKYHFVNQGDHAITASVVVPTGSNVTNVTVEYSTDGTTWISTNSGVTVAAGVNQAADYFIKVTIANVALNARFSGNFTWTLTNVA